MPDSPTPTPSLPSLRELLRLAIPIVLAQLAFFGMQTTDTIVAGQRGPEVLAGVALGGILLMIGFTLLLGFGLAVAPGVAQRYGAGAEPADIGRFVSASLGLSVALWSAWGIVLWWLPDLVLARLPLEPAVVTEATGYLRAVALGTPFLGVFFVLRNTIEALGHSRPIMWLGFAGLALNLPLDLVLMHGYGPIPALGAAGCGLATAIIHVLLAASLWLLLHRHREFVPYAPRGRPGRAGMGELWRLGLPLGLALMSEHAIFAAGGLVMTRFGTAAVAANQIAFNVTGLAFMLALGLGQATAVLVGQQAGRGQRAGVRRAGALGYGVTAVLAGAVAVALFTGAGPLLALYTRDAEVTAYALAFVKVAAIFHLVDALQALGSGALRGIKDTRYVLIATTLAYWGVGGLAMWQLLFVRDGGAVHIWWVFTVALAAAAGLLGLRFWQQLRRV